MADFRIVDEYPPSTANGCCYLCRASIRIDGTRKERVLDTNINIFQEGYLAICETCLTEAAGLFGMMTPEKAMDLRAVVDAVRSENLKMKTDLSIAEDVITSLTRYKEIVATDDK